MLRHWKTVYTFLVFSLPVGCADSPQAVDPVPTDAARWADAKAADPELRYLAVVGPAGPRWIGPYGEPDPLLLQCDVDAVAVQRHKLDPETHRWVAHRYMQITQARLRSGFGLQARYWEPCCNGAGQACDWEQLKSEQCTHELGSICTVSNCFTSMQYLDYGDNGSGPCCGGM